MNKAARTLIKYLDSKGLFVASSAAYGLFSYAGIEDHREKIDAAGRDREDPFAKWFDGKERIYLQYEEDSSTDEEKEKSLREEFKTILGWIDAYTGESSDEASLLYGRLSSGRRLGEKFFYQVLRKELEELHAQHSGSLTEDKRNFVSTISNQWGDKGIRNKHLSLLKETYNNLQRTMTEQGNPLGISLDDIYRRFLNEFKKNGNEDRIKEIAAGIYNDPASWRTPATEPSMSQEAFVSFFLDAYIRRVLGAPEDQLGAAIEDNKLIREEGLDKYSLIVNINNVVYEVKTTMSDYLNSPIRGNLANKDYLVVISKDPTDIAGMSTGKRWTSCMNLDGGGFSRGVYCEIREGGFIAYLINKEDKEVENPLARYRIRRFDSARTKEAVAIMEDELYSDGTEYPGFERIVQEWLDSKQGKLPLGTYFLRGGGYSDTFDDDSKIHTIDETSGAGGTISGLSKIVLNPEMIEKEDTYTVIDDLYNEHSEIFTDGDDDYYGDKITTPHLGGNGIIFYSRDEAEQWIKYESNYWREELHEFIWRVGDYSYELASEYDIKKNECGFKIEEDDFGANKALTSEGEDLLEFASGDRKRYSVLHTTKEEQIRDALNNIKSSLITKINGEVLHNRFDPSNVSDELFKELYDYAGIFKGNYRLIQLAKIFPERFTEEELSNLLATSRASNEVELDRMAEAYSNMKDSPRKRELRETLISSVLEKLDYERLRDGFERENRTEGAIRRKDGTYGRFKTIYKRRLDRSILGYLNEASPLRNNISDKLIDNFRMADKELKGYTSGADLKKLELEESSAPSSTNSLAEDPLTPRGAGDLKKDMVHNLYLIKAHNPRTISFYKEEMKKVTVKDRNDISRNTSPISARDWIHYAGSTGISGAPLIPELERLFNESQAIDVVFRDSKVLSREKREFGNLILWAVRAIREGS